MHQAYDRCKKVNRCNFNRDRGGIYQQQLAVSTHRNWPFEDTISALDRCTLNKGAFAFKIVRGALKWPLKGGSRLIEVAATAGLTVLCSRIQHNVSTIDEMVIYAQSSVLYKLRYYKIDAFF